MSLGIPIKVLHEAEGHIITCESSTGEVYRGKLVEAEEHMNLQVSRVSIRFLINQSDVRCHCHLSQRKRCSAVKHLPPRDSDQVHDFAWNAEKRANVEGRNFDEKSEFSIFSFRLLSKPPRSRTASGRLAAVVAQWPPDVVAVVSDSHQDGSKIGIFENPLLKYTISCHRFSQINDCPQF